jgi:hypothetical protein
MSGIINYILDDPARAMCGLRARLSRDGLFRKYSSLSKKNGINSLYFILSFDCDIEDDIKVAERIHEKLNESGIMPVYAVSGPFLKKGSAVFRRIRETGAEFINHGYTAHTYFDVEHGRHASNFFYDQLNDNAVKKDIVDGYKLLSDTLGFKPRGFRAPHFGTYQKKSQLEFMHSVLRELGCEFSTSTLPHFGLRKGAVYRSGGILEFPVSGMWTKPLCVLDSWTFYRMPERRWTESDYASEGRAIAEHFDKNSLHGILNYYADPSQIADSKSFFDTVKYWASVAENTSYGAIMDKLKP